MKLRAWLPDGPTVEPAYHYDSDSEFWWPVGIGLYGWEIYERYMDLWDEVARYSVILLLPLEVDE